MESVYKSRVCVTNSSPVVFRQMEQQKINNATPDVVDISEEKKLRKRVKTGVFLAGSLGILATLGLIAKGQRHKVFKKIDWSKWNKPKEWMLTNLKFGEKEIFMLAGGSISCSLLAGLLLDKKENRKSKFREAVFQSIANIAIPIATVAGGVHLLEKYHKALKIPDKRLMLAKGIATLGTLVAGSLIGNKVGNLINHHVFNSHEKRKIKMNDLCGHLDDTCLAVSYITNGNGIGNIASKFIPLAFIVHGYEAGTKTADEA